MTPPVHRALCLFVFALFAAVPAGAWVTAEGDDVNAKAEEERLHLAGAQAPDPTSTAAPMARMPLQSYELLSLRANDLAVRITSQMAVTEVTHVFQNNTSATLQAVYTMPLGPDAHLTGYAIYEKGERLPGLLLERSQAETIYTEVTEQEVPEEELPPEQRPVAVERWIPAPRDPGLMRLLSNNTFETRLYPLWPYDLKQMEVTYSELLARQDGVVTYAFPLRMTRFFENAIGEMTVSIVIEDQLPVRDVTCSLEGLSIERESETRVVIRGRFEQFRGRDDLVVTYRLEQDSPLEATLLCHRPAENDHGFFGLRLLPSVGETAGIDLLVLADVSPTMRAASKESFLGSAVQALLDAVRPRDRVQLWTCGPQLVQANGWMSPERPGECDELEAGFRALLESSARPALRADLGEDLLAACDELAEREDRSRLARVVVITDGRGGASAEKLAEVRHAAPSGTRIHVLHCGYDPTEAALRSIVGEAGAVHLCLGAHGSPRALERIRAASLRNPYGTLSWSFTPTDVLPRGFLDELRGQRLRRAELDFRGITTLLEYPPVLGSLGNGGSQFVFGRYTSGGSLRVHLSTTWKGERLEEQLEVQLPHLRQKNRFLGAFWSKEHVAMLERQAGGADSVSGRMRDEIVALSLEHRFVTRHTAFLSLPDKERKAYLLAEPVDDQEGFYEMSLESVAVQPHGFSAGVPEAEVWILLAVGLAALAIYRVVGGRA